MMTEVVANHLPSYWEDVDYTGGRYKLMQLGRGDMEYITLEPEFRSLGIESIQRLQNPYMYGRYLLRQEQLRVRGNTVHEKKMYHPVSKSDVKNVADFNCDYRRYVNGGNNAQNSGKKAVFYGSASLAAQALDHSGVGRNNMSIVVVKVAHIANYFPNPIVKDWDTEYYPEYIVNLA